MSETLNGHKKAGRVRAVEPRPVFVGRHQLAAILGVHPDRISEYRAAGLPVVSQGGLGGAAAGRRSRYDAIACAEWLRGHRNGALDALHERALLDRQRRESLEFDLACKRGQFIRTLDAEVIMSRAIKEASTAFLAVHARLAGRHPELPRQVILDIEREVRRVLEELADRAAPLLEDREDHHDAHYDDDARHDAGGPNPLGAATTNGAGAGCGGGSRPRASDSGADPAHRETDRPRPGARLGGASPADGGSRAARAGEGPGGREARVTAEAPRS